MPPTIELQDPKKTIEITSSDPDLIVSHRIILDFLQNLDGIAVAGNVSAFTVAPTQNPGEFLYSFMTTGGREWNETLLIAQDDPAERLVSCVGFWKDFEAAAHDAIVGSIIEMIRNFGVTLIETTWA